MGWPVCNTTLEDEKIDESEIWHGLTFHQLGLGLSAIFSAIAIIVSFFLMAMHATHYLQPNEQRHIIRILFMVPIYAAVSFLSYLYYRHSIYFEVIRDCYEAFAIASFFSLLCSYIAKDLHHQKHYFRTVKPKNWLWPMKWFQKCFGGDKGCLRTPRSGLTWFNVVWVAVFQYCFIRVTMTIVAVVTQAFDRYCLASLNPAFAHVWVMIIEAVAVTVAMYCLIQFYHQIHTDISEHKPLQKIIAIKLVIFLSFWQTIIISFLTSAGAIKPSKEFQAPDIKIGIPAMLLCIEMALFAIFHLFAFSWKPYVIGSKANKKRNAANPDSTPSAYQGGFLGTKAILDAFNPWDLIKAVGRAAKWLFRDRKTRLKDTSYDSTRMDSNLTKPTDTSASNVHSTHAHTAYAPHARPEVLSDEGQTLLSAPAPMPKNPINPHPQAYQPAASPYSQDGSSYFDPGTIGVAQSTRDDSTYYMPPTTSSHQDLPRYHGEFKEMDLESNSHSSSDEGRYELPRRTDSRQPRGG